MRRLPRRSDSCSWHESVDAFENVVSPTKEHSITHLYDRALLGYS